MNTGLKIAAASAGALVGFAMARSLLFHRRIDREIRRLDESRTAGSREVITEESVAHLPAPVQRYLRYAGVLGRRPIRAVQMEQHGRFRLSPDKQGLPFQATQYYSAAPPGFVWRAKLRPARLLPFAALQVFDRYLWGRGASEARLVGAIRIAESSGEGIDQGTALRFLGEMVFFPTAFVEPYVRWEPIDDNSAHLYLQHWPQELKATCYFTDDGKMVAFEALRHYEQGDTSTLVTWRTSFDDYVDIDGLKIPSRGKAIWDLDRGPFEYVDLKVGKVAYDAPLMTTGPDELSPEANVRVP